MRNSLARQIIKKTIWSTASYNTNHFHTTALHSTGLIKKLYLHLLVELMNHKSEFRLTA